MDSTSSTKHLYESGKSLSESSLWQLQYDYYQTEGIDAWGHGQTPSYITSNGFIARQYAEVVFGFFRDLHRKGHAHERIYLLEPGAGSGQFAFLFVHTLSRLVESAAFPVPEFCYILSDFAESNVKFWETHAKLAPFVDRGQVDFAVFDGSKDVDLTLRYSGKRLQKDSLQAPLIVLANYFFDSLPQDLFYINDGEISAANPRLYINGTNPSTTPSRLLKTLEMSFDLQELRSDYYPEAIFNDILEDYREDLDECWLLFPAPSFRMLDRLRNWTAGGLMLLTGDKGVQSLEELRGSGQPEIIVHGGFSFTVNYHAFQQFVWQNNGLGLQPSHSSYNLNVHMLLFREDADDFQELKNAFANSIGAFGPDDFFSLRKVIHQRVSKMKWQQIMATLRHSHFDTTIFQKLMPRIQELVPGLQAPERASILAAGAKIWETYFPINKSENLASDLANLSFALDDYATALTYLNYAIQVAPQAAETFFTAALCYDQLEDYDAAGRYLRLVTQMEPDHKGARELLEDYLEADG